MKHHIQRTSPKGQDFIGTCLLCGTAGLTIDDARKECENVRGLDEAQALDEVLTGNSGADGENR